MPSLEQKQQHLYRSLNVAKHPKILKQQSKIFFFLNDMKPYIRMDDQDSRILLKECRETGRLKNEISDFEV